MQDNNNMKLVNRTFIRKLLAVSGGTFVGIGYTKKDGNFTKLNGRLGVTRYLKTTSGTKFASDSALVTIYDVKRQGYRSLLLDNIDRVNIKGFEYRIA